MLRSLFSPRSAPLLLAVVLLSVTLTACDEGDTGNATNDEAQRALPVEVYTLEAMDFQDRVQVTGTLRALDDATLSAEIGGTLLSRADLGRAVRSGQQVARIDPTEAEAGVRQAEASVRSAETQLNLAEDAFNRQEPLYRDSIISAIEFERVRAELSSAEAGLAQAESALDQAREQLRRTSITTSFAGTVEDHLARRGEQLNPGEPVIRIVNTDSMRADVGIAERFMSQLQVGSTVEATFQSYPGETFEGRTLFVGRTIRPGSRTIPLEIEFPNPDGRLRPDMTARIAVPLESFEDVIVIPRRVTERDEEGTLVYVITDDDRVESRIIETGPSFDGRLVVLSGLAPDERLVVAGQTAVSDGDRVEIRETFTSLDDVMLQPRSTQASR